MCTEKKNPQMAISPYSFLSVYRQPQKPLAGATEAAGAPPPPRLEQQGQQSHFVGWTSISG